MDTDPFPAAVERLIATHDVGVPPTVFPNRKVTRSGAVSAPRPVPSPRGGMPAAAGVPSDGGEPPFATKAPAVGCSGRGAAPPDAGEAITRPAVAAPTGALGREEGGSTGNDAAGRSSLRHPTLPAVLSALWDWTQRRRWSDLAPIFERDARDAAWRKALGR